ncbi:MAG: pre-peptidase C-terminal domain-containing protein, partial [Waterburya sp.]
MINLVVLDIATLRAIAQDSASEPERDKAANTVKTTLEPEILSEINRVRTNPQAYAQWLAAQRRYYDGIWLKLPGEKPIRTNRGLKALEEAIAVLKTQQPLPPLDISQQTAATATSKLENFATANNIQNISYGRVTAKGIVMGIVVDDLFPDRRRRNNLLSSEAANTGVVCKPDPRYAKVCAIAYSDTPVDVAETQPTTNTTTRDTENTTSAEQPATTASQPETTETTTTPEVQVNPTTPETETTATQPETTETTTTPEVQVSPTTPETETTATQPESTENTTTPEQSATTNSPDSNDNGAATETLPQPPETLPGVPDVIPSNSEETVESSPTDNQDSEVAQEEENLPEATNENEDTEIATSDSQETTSEDTETAASDSQETTSEDTETATSETEANQNEEDVEVFEAEAGNPETEVATNSDSSSLLNNVERGTLEAGDRTIAEDGSLYDSYPIEGKAGDSFTINLESDEFDPFVALIDDKGNIIKQNDDIDQDNSNSQIQVTIPQDGVYNVIVNA